MILVGQFHPPETTRSHRLYRIADTYSRLMDQRDFACRPMAWKIVGDCDIGQTMFCFRNGKGQTRSDPVAFVKITFGIFDMEGLKGVIYDIRLFSLDDPHQ